MKRNRIPTVAAYVEAAEINPLHHRADQPVRTCFRHLRRMVAALACGAALSGCAANMAATGSNGPDLNVVGQETTRLNVERSLGSPEKLQQQANGDWVAVYEVEPRTKPSLARAAGHGTLDLFTFGLWEVVGGPAEMAHARRVLVTARYDQAGNLLQMTSKPKPIL